jgi:hypothetical protein
MIFEAVLAMELGASTEDLQRTILAYPSLAETVPAAIGFSSTARMWGIMGGRWSEDSGPIWSSRSC